MNVLRSQMGSFPLGVWISIILFAIIFILLFFISHFTSLGFIREGSIHKGIEKGEYFRHP